MPWADLDGKNARVTTRRKQNGDWEVVIETDENAYSFTRDGLQMEKSQMWVENFWLLRIHVRTLEVLLQKEIFQELFYRALITDGDLI